MRWKSPFYETFVLSHTGRKQLIKRFPLRPEALSHTSLLTVTHLFECDLSTIESWKLKRTTGYELKWHLEDEMGKMLAINYTEAKWEKDKKICFGDCSVMLKQGYLNSDNPNKVLDIR